MRRVRLLLVSAVLLMGVTVRPVHAQAVRVTVVDETIRHPLAQRAEVWVRANGSWFFKRALGRETLTAENLTLRRVGVRDTLFVYADGRNGKELKVPFTITTSMCQNGCVRDTIWLTIIDDAVQVWGQPVTKATFSRR